MQDDVAFLSASQPFVAQGGTGDVSAEAFESGVLMRAAVHGGMKAKALGADTAPGLGLRALAWRGPEQDLSRSALSGLLEVRAQCGRLRPLLAGGARAGSPSVSAR